MALGGIGRGDSDDLGLGRPKNRWRRLWESYSFSVLIYFIVAVIVLIAYHLVSDGDFSFLMTLGSILSVCSFSLLGVKAYAMKDTRGISLKTLQAYAAVFTARLASILLYEGYLPFDRSGDWFYQCCEGMCLLLVLLIIVAVVFVHPRGYERTADAFGALHIPSQLGVLYLVLPCAALALVLHPNLNNFWATDSAWAFALYLEAVAVLPQLRMFQKAREKAIEPFTANFVFGVALARVLNFVFWLSSFHELNDKYAAHFQRKYPGYLVVLSQVVNLLLMADYMYYFVLYAQKGRGPVLPQTL